MQESSTNADGSGKKTFKQVVTYLLVGGGTALFELGLFLLFYHVLNLGIIISNVTAIVVATACNFALNGTVTFKQATNLPRSIALYILLFLFNTAFTTWAIGALIGLGAPSALAKISAQICIVIWNFFLYKKIIFI